MTRYALALGLALASIGSACVERRDVTPLMAAARTGDVAAMRQFLDAGADPDERDQLNGWTPLFHAIHKGRIEAVRLLLDRGVDPDQRAGGDTAVWFAKESGEPAIVDLLVEYGGNPHPPRSPVQHVLEAIGKFLP
jgi:ankyrin repeat protein